MVCQSLVRDSHITRFKFVDPDRRVLTRLECSSVASPESPDMTEKWLTGKLNLTINKETKKLCSTILVWHSVL